MTLLNRWFVAVLVLIFWSPLLVASDSYFCKVRSTSNHSFYAYGDNEDAACSKALATCRQDITSSNQCSIEDSGIWHSTVMMVELAAEAATCWACRAAVSTQDVRYYGTGATEAQAGSNAVAACQSREPNRACYVLSCQPYC